MKWTNQKPTGPGYYWHRLNSKSEPTVKHVYWFIHYPDGETKARSLVTDEREDCQWLEDFPGQWSKPIPEPETVPQPNGIDPGCALDLNEKLK